MADVELRPMQVAKDASSKESDPSAAQSNEEESSGAAVVEDVESKPSDAKQPSANGKSKDEPTGGDPTSLSPEEEDDDAIEFIDKSFFLFEPTHPIRAFCISVITNRWFSWFILLVIVLNAAFLAANDPLKGRKEGFNVVNYYADFVFLAIFVIEAILKIVAMGFILHQYSYLRDGWNWIDLIVVIVSIINQVPGVGNLTALRALRLLRPLRTISRVQGMRIIVNSLLVGARSMFNVLLLVIVVFIIFGGAAVQMWSGVLRQHCYDRAQVVNEIPVYPNEYAAFWQCARELDGRRCNDGQMCLPYGDNPNCGYTNFDNIGYTWLQMYVIMTFDNWASTMYALQDTWSNEAFIWFLLFAFVTVFFILNLTLAVVEESFSDEKEKADDLARRKKERARRKKARLRAQGMTATQAKLAVKPKDSWSKIEACMPPKRTPWNMPDSPFCHKLRVFFRRTEWGIFITAIIVINTFIMALDHYPQSSAWERLQIVSNIIFTAIYALEMIFKMIALGPWGYVSDPYNDLDGFLVITSIVDLAASFINIKALRVLRLLRIARLMGKLKGMRVVVLMLRKSLLPLLYITLVMFLYLFIFAVLGRQLFAGRFNPPPEGTADGNCAGAPGDPKPRSNYDTFWEAFVTTFQISIFEDWSHTMYIAMKGTTGWTVTVIGVFMILNLFVAMLMHAFEDASDEVERNRDLKDGADLPPSNTPSQTDVSTTVDNEESEEERKRKAAMLQIKVVGGEVHLQMLDEDDIAAHEKRMAREGGGVEIGLSQGIRRNYYIPPEVSLGFLAVRHPVRRSCIKLVSNKWFEWLVFVIVLTSCLFLALDQPGVSRHSNLGKAIVGFNWIFAVLFTTEIVVKVIALGLFAHKGAYLRDVWNCLDVVITVFTILALALPSVQAIRSFRAVRPLRLLTKSTRTKVVIMAFFRALIPIGHILIVVCIVWLVFAILGVQLWKGTFYSCNDPNVRLKDLCNGTFVDDSGAVVPRDWSSADVNFDNTGYAFLTLARVATAASWLIPVWSAEDAAALYFLIFTIIGGFFALSLFIAALMDQFHDQAKQVNGSAFLDEKQNLWLTFTRIVATAAPVVRVRRPAMLMRKVLYDLVTHPIFDPFMMGVIAFNVLIILLAHYPSTVAWERLYSITNYLFLLIFLVEAVFKLIGLGPKGYFRDGWNIFDFCICILTVAGGIAELFITVPGSPSFLRVFRSLRLLRIFRFIPRLRDFIDTLVFVLPSSLNVLTLLVVVWYIFAVVAMNVMGNLPECDQCNINRRSNFGTFGKSLLTVFVLMTGDGWSDHMVEAAQTNQAYYVYYMALIVFVMLILLNLFIAVVMEEFSSFKNTRHERLKLDNFLDFAVLWARKDPYGERRIPAMELVPMLWALGDPLGFASTMGLHQVFNALAIMDVPIYPDKTVRYEHVLQGLVRWGLQLDMKDMRFNYKEKGITAFTVAHLYATQTLQKVFRRRRAVRMLRRALELKDMTPEERLKAAEDEKLRKEERDRAKTERALRKEKKSRKGKERKAPAAAAPPAEAVARAEKKDKKGMKERTPEEEQAHRERKERRRKARAEAAAAAENGSV